MISEQWKKCNREGAEVAKGRGEEVPSEQWKKFGSAQDSVFIARKKSAVSGERSTIHERAVGEMLPRSRRGREGTRRMVFGGSETRRCGGRGAWRGEEVPRRR